MEKKIGVIGMATHMTALAQLPDNVRIVDEANVDEWMKQDQETRDALVRGINRMNNARVEGEMSSLQNFYMPQGAYVAKGKHRKGNNSKRPKPRKKKR